MLHFVKSYMKQNKSRKQTLESAQYGLEISFKAIKIRQQFKAIQGINTMICRKITAVLRSTL